MVKRGTFSTAVARLQQNKQATKNPGTKAGVLFSMTA
jgi:hypothetical protein